MKSIHFIMIITLLFQGSFSSAKRKRPPKAFSFITMAEKASQGECDGEWKIPRKLKKQKEMSKYGSYMGSELQEPEFAWKENEEMWKHFYRNKASCNQALAKTPSSVNTSPEKKPDLPPEEPAESEEEADEAETSAPEASE